LLVVEFCDTKDEHGIYRKYSAYKIRDRVVPRYVECSRDWMVKWDWRIFDRVRADEEIRYLETNPHDAWIREIFEVAGIDYGRVDYGVLDGIPQVWEINTNPTIGRGPGPKVPYRPDVGLTRRCSRLPSGRFTRTLKRRGARPIPPPPRRASSSTFRARFAERSRPARGSGGAPSESASSWARSRARRGFGR
jgi:hypothetical protein